MKTYLAVDNLEVDHCFDGDKRLKCGYSLSDADEMRVSRLGKFIYTEEHSGIHTNPPWEYRVIYLPKEG